MHARYLDTGVGMNRSGWIIRALFLAVLLLGTFASAAHAATIVVGGPNGCSLANAIRSANDDAPRGNCTAGEGTDVIVTPDDWSVTLESRLPTVDSSVFIRTETDAGLLTISGDGQHQIMRVSGADTTLTLERVAMIDGHTGGATGRGVAALNIKDANVFAFDSHFGGHQGSPASAISVEDGLVHLDRVIISGDNTDQLMLAVSSAVSIFKSTLERANLGESFQPLIEVTEQSDLEVAGSLFDSDAGIRISENSTADVVNSTITGPGRTSIPSGIWAGDGSSLFLSHSTVIRRLAVNDSFLSLVNSLIGPCSITNTTFILNTGNFNRSDNCLGTRDGDAGLQPLADNGGPTQTRAMFLFSDLVDSGNQALCEPLDQRGITRTDLCDVGAFELATVANVRTTISLLRAAPYAPGQEVGVLVQLFNDGPELATAVEIDFETVRASIRSNQSSVCPSFPCQISSLLPEQSVTIPLVIGLDETINTNFELQASALSTADSVHRDPDEGGSASNNRAVVQAPISAAADLAVSMDRLTPLPYVIGQVLNYEVLIKNDGPQAATDVSLQFDTENLVFQEIEGCVSFSGPFCDVGTVANGGSTTITAKVEITGSPFDVSVSAFASEVDIDLSNNIDNLNNGGAITLTDISVGLSMLTNPPNYSNQLIEYEIVVNALEAVSGFQLDYEFPGAELIGIEFCSLIPCEFPFQLDSGESLTFSARFFAPFGPTEGEFSVTVTPNQSDTDLSNNSISLNRTFLPAADIFTRLNLQTDPPYVAGQEIVYYLEVFNLGADDASGLEIDVLAENLSLRTVTGQQCQTVDCSISQLDRFNQENITLVYEIGSAGDFDLQASAFADQIDSNPLNNVDDSGNGDVAGQGALFDQISVGDFEPSQF